MTRYDYICNNCEVIWEQDHPLGKAPKETECPECGEMRGRNWASVTTFIPETHHNKPEEHEEKKDNFDEDIDLETALSTL